MKKVPLIQILIGFYRRDVMKYVGSQWKGYGMLLLFGICAYCSLFITYSWYSKFKGSYSSFYKPAISQLPDFTIVNESFEFTGEMPIKIYHPITRKPVFYIDTRDVKTEKLPTKFPFVILKDFIPSIPLPWFASHAFVNASFLGDLQEGETYSGKDLTVQLESQEKAWISAFFFISFGWMAFLALIKTLLITMIVMFMFKGNKIKKDFKLINRLCILTYIPVMLVNGTYQFFLEEMGFLMLIFLSFFHIVLLMTALAANSDEKPSDAPIN
jgi:hypothetical protein